MRAALWLGVAALVACAPEGGDGGEPPGAELDARVGGQGDLGPELDEGQPIPDQAPRPDDEGVALDGGPALDEGPAADEGLEPDEGPIPEDQGLAPDAGPPAQCPPEPSPLQVDVQVQGRWRFVDGFPTQQADLAPRGLRIYLPAAYDQDPERRFPVLYMHDGQNLYDGRDATFGVAWEVDDTVDDLTARGIIEPVIVVGVDNTPDRISDYTPSVDPEWGGAGNAAAYGRFLVEELKPWIDTRFRTRCGRLDTAVAGSSLGGLVSLYLLRAWPEVFGRVGAFSPSLWWNGREAVAWGPQLAAALGDDGRLWLDGGNLEGSDDDLDGRSSVVANNRALAEAVWAQGVDPVAGLGYLETPFDAHNEAAWARRLPVALAWLLGGPPEGAPAALAVRPFASFLSAAAARPLSVDATWPEHALTLPDALAEWAVDGPAQVQAGQGTALAEGGAATLTASWRGVQGSAEVALAATAVVTFQVFAEVGTPEPDPLWLTGDRLELGDWIPLHGVRLASRGAQRWTGQVALPAGARVEYKVTRGSWETVEKFPDGGEVPNHVFVAEDGDVIDTPVVRWADW